MSPPTATKERPRPPAIDPRIRARRIEVRRNDGRRRLRRLIVAAALLGALALVLVVIRSPLLDVDRIKVSGATHETDDAVRAATGLRRHMAMIDVDTGAARARLLGLPWVADATVTRRWPGTVQVAVRERTPVALAPAGAAGFGLLDAEGRVLDVTTTPPSGLAVLSGFPDVGAPGTTAPPDDATGVAVAAALPASLRPQVQSIVLADGGQVLLQLAGGPAVRLGSTDELPAKLLATLTVLGQVDLTGACTIDVRVPTAPTLTRGSPCA